MIRSNGIRRRAASRAMWVLIAVMPAGVLVVAHADQPSGPAGDAGAPRAEISIGGLIQGRYGYERLREAEDVTELSLRRAFLDLRGSLVDPSLTFRFQLDVSDGEARLRDLWIRYRVRNEWHLQLGQFVLPFGLPRSIAGPLRLVTELSIAGNEFEIPQGRDVGIMLQRCGNEGRWQMAGGVFDGRGRLDLRDERPASSGLLLSARFVYAIVGAVPADNVTLGRPMENALAVGFGIQHANRNALRDWRLGTSTDTGPANAVATWTSHTVDAVLKHGRVMVSAALFERRVSATDRAPYVDRGGELELAFAAPFWNLEPAIRYALIEKDTRGHLRQAAVAQNRLDEYLRATGRSREWAAGINVYHREHRHKTQLFWFDHDRRETDWTVHLQHQLRF
jgi:phosphate-selective porin OprO and OprP